MVNTKIKEKCCGCEACAVVCPQKCIAFDEDIIGANYPIVDKKKCINCGLCETVCPLKRKFENKNLGLYAYAAFSKNGGVRFRGTSGGIFESVAQKVINDDDGIVFACKFDSELQLKCFEAVDMESVRTMTKSKYLQSDCKEVYERIKYKLQEGQTVLFCSTPCQIAAVKSYVGRSYYKGSLILIDFFCHGTPQQKIFDLCRQYVEEKRHIQIIDYVFRSKKPLGKGATPHYYTYKYKYKGRLKEEQGLYLKDPFFLGFQKYLTQRDSCYHCPYSLGNHEGDLTIGDFHEVDKYVSGINRFDGVSMVIVNTELGKELWSRIKDGLVVYNMDLMKLYRDRQIFAGYNNKPKCREEFIKDLESLEFYEIVNKYFNSKKEWKKNVYYSLPASMRKIIKRMAMARL